MKKNKMEFFFSSHGNTTEHIFQMYNKRTYFFVEYCFIFDQRNSLCKSTGRYAFIGMCPFWINCGHHDSFTITYKSKTEDFEKQKRRKQQQQQQQQVQKRRGEGTIQKRNHKSSRSSTEHNRCPASPQQEAATTQQHNNILFFLLTT